MNRACPATFLAFEEWTRQHECCHDDGEHSSRDHGTTLVRAGATTQNNRKTCSQTGQEAPIARSRASSSVSAFARQHLELRASPR
jgi:hypothetical protein